MLNRLTQRIVSWLARHEIDELKWSRLAPQNGLASAVEQYREAVQAKSRVMDERDSLMREVDRLNSMIRQQHTAFAEIAAAKSEVIRQNEDLRDQIDRLMRENHELKSRPSVDLFHATHRPDDGAWAGLR